MIFLLTVLLISHMGILTPHAAQIFRYDTSIVTLRAGNAWTINGNMKLIHVINLEDYTIIANNVTTIVQKHLPPSQNKDIINYYLAQVQERLTELKGISNKKKRSIDWIGSAWKWVAGNPDATDWNEVLKTQNAIITNNNEQYKINTQLLNATNEVVQRTNELVSRMNEIGKGNEAERIGQGTINQVLVLKDAIDDIVRACQMAKSGIVNTNLLDRTEIEEIITEMETLPYSNAIEAIEYGEPTIYTNGTLLLYIVSIPKLKKDFYHRLIVRPAIKSNKQIELQFNEILISQNETFGVRSPCLYINNITVCRKSSLSQLPEESCVPRLLKGGTANCQYRTVKAQIVEMITSDMVFLTNFIGVISTRDHSELLNGTYLIQLFNETILLGNETFSSTSISTIQPLPPVLTSVTNERLLVDIDQVHNISLNNIDRIHYLKIRSNLSLGGHIGIIIMMSVCLGILWYKITRRLNLPALEVPPTVGTSLQPSIMACGTQTFEEGGVNGGVGSASGINSAQ